MEETEENDNDNDVIFRFSTYTISPLKYQSKKMIKKNNGNKMMFQKNAIEDTGGDYLHEEYKKSQKYDYQPSNAAKLNKKISMQNTNSEIMLNTSHLPQISKIQKKSRL